MPSSASTNDKHPSLRRTKADWLRAFWPAPIAVDGRERWRITVGATLGILLTAILCHQVGANAAGQWAWLVAPIGATAVLVFAVPASPLAQPWAVVGGNTLSALVGIACARWIGPVELAAALSVGLALGLMLALRCLHPPGGAVALLLALTGVTDPMFVLFPVLANSLLLVLTGIVYNNATRRTYPHLPLPSAVDAAGGEVQERSIDADLDAVLARYNQVLDISRDDLKAVLEDIQLHAYQRKLANIRCGDIMSRALVTVSHSTELQHAWKLFAQHHIKALPVVDASGCIVGIVTPADFMREANIDGHDGLDVRLRKLRGWTDGTALSRPAVVGEIMSRQVRVASVDRHLVELIPLFGGTGHHHIPVVGAGHVLLGMITQSDVVAALSKLTTMQD